MDCRTAQFNKNHTTAGQRVGYRMLFPSGPWLSPHLLLNLDMAMILLGGAELHQRHLSVSKAQRLRRILYLASQHRDKASARITLRFR